MELSTNVQKKQYKKLVLVEKSDISWVTSYLIYLLYHIHLFLSKHFCIKKSLDG